MPVGGKVGIKLKLNSPRWLECDGEGPDGLRGAEDESGSCIP